MVSLEDVTDDPGGIYKVTGPDSMHTAVQAEQRWQPEQPWANPAGRLVCSSRVERGVWLAARRSMLCASDLAALLGVSNYGDPFTVWADKTGRSPEETQTDPMARGLILEDGVIDLWRTRYCDFPIETRRQGLVRSRDFGHAGATVDRISICPLGRCIVEAKTQNDAAEWGSEHEPEVPTAFQFQGQWQLYVTGRHHVHFVVLGSRFVPQHRIMFRDEELIASLAATVKEWWAAHVEADQPPAATRRAAETLKRMYGNPLLGERYELTEDDAELARVLPGLKAAAVDAQYAYDDALAQLQARVGDATEVCWPGEPKPVATWRPGRTVDGANKAWRLAHRALAEAYEVPSTELDVAKMVENNPELLVSGGLRRRRTWTWK